MTTTLLLFPAVAAPFWAFTDLNTGEDVVSDSPPPWSLIQFVIVGKKLCVVER